jgi:hypothetical protein
MIEGALLPAGACFSDHVPCCVLARPVQTLSAMLKQRALDAMPSQEETDAQARESFEKAERFRKQHKHVHEIPKNPDKWWKVSQPVCASCHAP